MKNATQVLRNEHDAILRMLEATEEVARRLGRRERVDAQIPENILEFLRLFADRGHHGKEEELLFPLLQKKGMPRQGGPIGVMLHEHDLGREFIRQMVEASTQYASGDIDAGVRWAAAAVEYVALLREHIYKENEVLFVLAERILSDAEQLELAQAFERVETEKLGARTHERLHALMEKLLADLQPVRG